MLAKILILVLMFIILAALLHGLLALVRDESKTRRTVHALTVRIICSVGLFAFLLMALHFHWLAPHGMVPHAAIAAEPV